MFPLLPLLLACTPDPRESPPPTDSEPAWPDPPSVRIEPPDPDGLDDLYAVVEATVDQVVALRWWVDGQPQEGLGVTVPAALTAHGQRWTVEAAAEGGRAWDRVTIGDIPPTTPTVELTPAEPMAAVDDLRCAVTATDPDGDVLLVTVAWTVDGVPAGVPLERGVFEGDTVPAEALVAGQVWACAAEVDDGWGGLADGASAPVTVAAFEPARLDPWIEPEVWIEPLDATAGSDVVLHYRGALAGQEAVTARLGFDGWTQVTWDSAPTQSATEEGAPVFSWERPMQPQGDGTWALPLTLPAPIHAIHMVFAAGDATDDAEGLEYHWDPSFPYVGPFLTWSDAVGPADGVVVTFESAVPSLGVVVYSGPDGLARARVGEALHTLHHITLDGLSPDTPYTGFVADSTGRCSEPFSFQTVGEDTERLSLLVLGDMQDGGTIEDRWPAIAAAALAAAPEARAAVLVGDLAANDNPGHWWRFFAGGAPLFARVPLIPMIGNHDTPGVPSDPDSSSFERWFDLPGAEVYYAVDLGPARIIALNSEVIGELQDGSEQYAWLEELLDSTAADQRPWVFAGFHHPPYDIGARFADDAAQYRPVTALFDGVVDWFIAGHEHIYQRTIPLQYRGQAAPSGSYGIGPDDGTGYLVVPTAGDNTFDHVVLNEGRGAANWALMAFPEPPGGADYPEEQGFISIALDGPGFTLSSWGMGTVEAPLEPWVRDVVSYSKP
ncbi:MAG: metallophosphoesterase family protein [Pseudomonadota bacterium]